MAEILDARRRTWARAVGEARKTERRWIDDGRRTCDQISAQASGGGAYTEAMPRKAGGNEEARNLVAAGDHGKGVRRRVRGYSFGWRPIDRSPTNLLGLSRSQMRPRRQLSFS